MGAAKVRQASPIRQSPRKISATQRTLPHSASPSTSTSTTTAPFSRPTHRSTHSESSSVYRFPLPPAFEYGNRYAPSLKAGYSPVPVPYRPGEYGRLERGSTSDRTELVGRKLFDGEEEEMDPVSTLEGAFGADAEAGRSASASTSGRKKGPAGRGSSPLAPAFEAKMVLRNGASVDLISWLRTNFHHISPHSAMTPSMSLIGIRALLLERFPRVPDLAELSKAVSVAFPHSAWDYPTGAYSHSEPPMIKGLVWHGSEVEDDLPDKYKKSGTAKSRPVQGHASGSRSPTQSTLVSPTSSSTRKHLPNTPARSVLEEFAELASLAEKTPMSKTRSLPGEVVAPAPAFALANLCNSFADGSGSGFASSAATAKASSSNGVSRKRKASASSHNHLDTRRRATTPDKLQDLIAAAEAVEGSPINSLLGDRHGHKRRRTIGGDGAMREVLTPKRNRSLRNIGTTSPMSSGLEFLPIGEDTRHVDMLVPLNDTASPPPPDIEMDEDAVSTLTPSKPIQSRTLTSSTSTTSSISHTLPSVPAQTGMDESPTSTQASHPHSHSHSHSASTSTSASSSNLDLVTGAKSENGNGNNKQAKRKINELPTTGLAPGVDCKPPYPYHEMIRFAIENSQEGKLQLSQIYASIAERFPFFATLDSQKTAGWQNSIRHNLSLKKMFVRVNKPDTSLFPDENGKGGWWTVQPGIPDEGRPGRKSKVKEKDVVVGKGKIAGEGLERDMNGIEEMGTEDRGQVVEGQGMVGS